MKKLYFKHKKLLIFTVVLSLVFSLSAFSVSAFTDENIDDKQYRVLYIPIDKPTVSQNADVSTAYVEIYYTNMSGSYNVETVVFQYHTSGNPQLTINNDNFYFNLSELGFCSCMWISSSGGGGTLTRKFYSTDMPNYEYNPISFSGYTRIIGFRVYGINAVTDNCNYDYKNWIVNYGSTAITNSNLSTIISQFEQNNVLLNEIYIEQQKSNGFLGEIKDFVSDIRDKIVGNEDEQPQPDDSAITENEQAEQEIRNETDYGFNNAESLIGGFGSTADSNSNIGRAMVGIASMINETTQLIIPDIQRLLTWSMTIGLICFILGMAQMIGKATKSNNNNNKKGK